MPEFYGEDPARASDGNHVYRFLGWSPEFARVTGEAEYQAQYDAVPILKPGENTVPVRPFEPVRCPFIPADSGGYRFWSTDESVNAVVEN